MGTSKNVATHPVAQLKQEDIPLATPLQSTHRSLSLRTRTFHTTYDSVGRLIQGKSGFEVNGRTDWGSETPYRNNMSYNAFGEVDSVSGQHWGHTVNSPGYTVGATTGRVSTSGYDAAGNITLELIDAVPNPDINRTMRYDAAGRNVYIHDPIVHTCCENDHQYDTTFDGNGWRVRNIDTSDPPGSTPAFTGTTYEFRSTVFGGEVVGRLSVASWTTNQGHGWVTPINGVNWGDNPEKTAPEGIKTYGGSSVELDTRGADVGNENPYNTGDGGTGYPGTGGDPTQAHRCAAGGVPEPCDPNSRAEQAWARIQGLIQEDSDNRREERKKKKPVLRYSAYALRKMGIAESSTSKPSSRGEIPGSLDSSSVPDATGDNEEDGCESTKDGPNCHVQSLPWNFDDVDAAQTLKDIFDAARTALKTPKRDETGISCSELFAGKGLEFLDAYEKSIGKNGALRFGKETADGGKFATEEYAQTSRRKTAKVGNEKYSVIAFNSASALFSSETFGFTGKSSKDFGHLTFVEFWAAALLHEIGHSIRNRFGEDPQKGGLIDPDSGDSGRSRANQVFVAETCFPKK